MRNLSELSNEQLFDLMIAVYEPYSTIASDENVKSALRNSFSEGMQIIRDKYMKEAVEICAIMDGVPVEGYKMGIFTFMRRFSELLTADLGMNEVFTSQQSEKDSGSSGDATENTEGSVM